MNGERIARILGSGCRAVFALTGGGSGALHALFSTPGASRLVVEALVPYSPPALKRLLGETPAQSVSADTALKMARAAFLRASGESGLMAVACTAALQTDRERRGADRAFIAVKTGAGETVYALYLSGASRAEQEERLSGCLLALTAQAAGAERPLLLPGSFNPPHRGHFRLLAAAERRTGLSGAFELSRLNVDKPELDGDEVLRRIAALPDVPVALTAAPRFIEKARLFPGAVFAAGRDTAERLIAYAQPGEWAEFRRLGVRFLVAGREEGGVFRAPESLPVPPGAEDLFDVLPEAAFREDISSTALRREQEGA